MTPGIELSPEECEGEEKKGRRNKKSYRIKRIRFTKGSRT